MTSKIVFISIFLLLGASASAQFPFEKGKTLYFNLPGINESVPYSNWSQNLFQVNDSTVYDIKFNKWNRKVTAIAYKSKEYYNEGYAKPILISKYQLEMPKLDTVFIEKPITAEIVGSINKHYKGKLIGTTSSASQSSH